MNPSSSRASSDIIDLSQAGSKVISTLHDSTPSTFFDIYSTSERIISAAGQFGAVSVINIFASSPSMSTLYTNPKS